MSLCKFSVIIEKDKDGYYAFCPELQGCYTQGDTYEEALENIKDAIRLHVEDRLAEGEEIPQAESACKGPQDQNHPQKNNEEAYSKEGGRDGRSQENQACQD